MSKRVMVVAGTLVTVALMSGCTIGGGDEKTKLNIEKVDVSMYEKKVIEGEFGGVLNRKFVDVKTKDKTEMLKVANGLVEDMATIKYDSIVKFSYEFDKKEMQNVITGILEVDGKPYKGLRESEQKVVEITKVDEKIAYDPEGKGALDIDGKKIDAYEWNVDGVHTKAPVEFQRDEDVLIYKDMKVKYHVVEDTPANDIQNERWRAASVLGEVGDFKEADREEEYIKFLFYVQTKEVYKEIMVIKRGDKYIRVEWEAGNKEDYIDMANAIIENTR